MTARPTPLLALALGLSCLPGCLVSAPIAEVEPDAADARGAAEAAAQDTDAGLRAHLARARAALDALDGYGCELVKEERVGDELYAPQRLYCKVRHAPFAVYLRFLEPEVLAGQEALWAGERYDGELVARPAGALGAFGAQRIDPEGGLAMRGNRYPITETGMLRLLEKVEALLEPGAAAGAVTIGALRLLEGARVDGRPCRAVEAELAGETPFRRVRLYFDEEWGLPVAYEGFEEHEGELRLLESYAYEALDLDVTWTDADFDRANPEYGLR